MSGQAGVPIKDALDSAQIAIGAAGSPTPRLDAELLLCHTLGITREQIYIDRGELTVQGGAVRELQALVYRRAVAREPIAYLVGHRAFRALELRTDARALIPRPETELLVEAALELAPPQARVIDIGTGSGAIALALATERPDLQVWGSDIDPAALALARENAAHLGASSVSWLQADGVPEGNWDVVVANPPYIPSAELSGLEVARHEPVGALDGGPDGLATLRRLIEQAAHRVDLIALEVGQGQAVAVAELLRRAAYGEVSRRRDLAGVERVVLARR